MAAVAYFLTWSVHGTWVHGDPRGSVDRSHNRYGAPLLEPDAAIAQTSAPASESSGVPLSDAERSIVEAAIRDHCAHAGWRLIALNVRTTHVHVVVGRVHIAPERALGQLKSWATRRLREAGLRGAERLWTREGSTRYLFDDESVERAARYAVEGQ